jgi:hypothetical protein
MNITEEMNEIEKGYVDTIKDTLNDFLEREHKDDVNCLPYSKLQLNSLPEKSQNDFYDIILEQTGIDLRKEK